jgi:putative ABC transport system permease protein
LEVVGAGFSSAAINVSMFSASPVTGKASLWRLLLHPWIWQMAIRDTRRERRRLAIFTTSIVIGITALVTVHALRDSFERGFSLQARALLGSDLQVSARVPLDQQLLKEVLGDAATAISYETAFTTMLGFKKGAAARLVQLRVIEGGFPFYGTVLSHPGRAWADLAGEQAIVVTEPALLDQFGIGLGETVQLGSAAIAIGGTVVQAAPRSGRFAGFAPDVYTNRVGLAASGLLEQTALASFHAHIQLVADADIDALRNALTAAFSNHAIDIETPESRREQLGRILDRVQSFLGLLATFSLILGAIGVASALNAQIRRRRSSIAILRCLGVSARAATAIYGVQAGVLGIIGSFAGVWLGVLLHAFLMLLFRDVLPLELSVFPALRVLSFALAVGFATCLGFAALPLVQIAAIAPLQVLRAQSQQKQKRLFNVVTAGVGAGLFGLLILLATMSSASLLRGAAMALAWVVLFLLLALSGKLVIVLARWCRGLPFGFAVRQGIANLFRPNNHTLLLIVALGLGIFLLSLTLHLRAWMLTQLDFAANTGPNLYLVDIQADQVTDLKTMLLDNGLPVLEAAPMVAMRLQSIAGIPVRELAMADRIPPWVLRREFRSSYRAVLNSTEKGVAGVWPPSGWDGNQPIPLSLETGVAADLGVDLGDTMQLDIQGIVLEVVVTHLREVDWSRFNLNFFMLFPPGVLEDAPGFHVLTTATPEGMSSGHIQAVLARSFPNVSVIDLTQILQTISDILKRMGQAVQVLALFTLAAGLCILVGVLLNNAEERQREVALLRMLGASNKQLRTLLRVEFGSLGLLAALVGTGLALIAHLLLLRFSFQANSYSFDGIAALALLFGSVLLAIIIGSLLRIKIKAL